MADKSWSTLTVTSGSTQLQLEVDAAGMDPRDLDYFIRKRLGLGEAVVAYYTSQDCEGPEVLPSVHHKHLHVKTLGAKRTTVSYTETAPMFFYAIFVLLLSVGLAVEIEGLASIEKFIKSCSKMGVDALVNGISWATTYVFIRRYLNPETNITYQKYFMDSLFGGLAVMASTFMKEMFKRILAKHT